MAADKSAKLAVLIDADNAEPGKVQVLLTEVAKYGTAFVKRAYGDWTGTNLSAWKQHLLLQSIQPIQQFAYTQGKNATDSAMIIDAMDLLYSNRFDGFCLVSSDSDFTRLAARLRESGLVVYGFGRLTTPKPFVAACDKFVYLENLDKNAENHAAAPPQAGEAVRAPPPQASEAVRAPAPRRRPRAAVTDAGLTWLLRNAVQGASGDDGWSRLANVGQMLTRMQPDFDSHSYGYEKLSDLIVASGLFDTTARTPGEGKPPVTWVRERETTS